jgi:hypothetical protein
MAELTPLDEKLGEVLGLAQAAQDATKQVSGMEDAEDFADDLQRMREQAQDTERRTDEIVDGLEGKKTAIRDKARETKREAVDMMKTYLGDEEEALDGFEFLSMAEAGELCHWEIVETIAEKIGAQDVHRLASQTLEIQREHVATVRRAYLALAAEEAEG